MKLKPLLISLAAVSALAAGAANAAQVIVTTGAGYVKMVDALAALYQKETASPSRRASAATSARCSPK